VASYAWASVGRPCARNFHSQHEQFPVNPRRTPIRVRPRHPLDPGSDLRTRWRPTPTFPPRNPGPIHPEALSLPADDRVTVHQVQCLSPRGPDSGKHDPKPSVFPLQSRHSLPSLEHSQLLSQSQILPGQVTAFSQGCSNQKSQPSQCLDHGLERGRNDLNNQQISSRWSFGDGQVAGEAESADCHSIWRGRPPGGRLFLRSSKKCVQPRAGLSPFEARG
jgi:hypothetical protein